MHNSQVQNNKIKVSWEWNRLSNKQIHDYSGRGLPLTLFLKRIAKLLRSPHCWPWDYKRNESKDGWLDGWSFQYFWLHAWFLPLSCLYFWQISSKNQQNSLQWVGSSHWNCRYVPFDQIWRDSTTFYEISHWLDWTQSLW